MAYDLHLWPTLLSLFYTLKTEQLGCIVKSLFRESCIYVIYCRNEYYCELTHLFWYRTRVSSSFWMMKRNVLLVYQIIALRLKKQISCMSQMTCLQVLLLLPSSLNLYPIKHGHCHGVFILKPSWVKGHQNWLLTSADIKKNFKGIFLCFGDIPRPL